MGKRFGGWCPQEGLRWAASATHGLATSLLVGKPLKGGAGTHCKGIIRAYGGKGRGVDWLEAGEGAEEFCSRNVYGGLFKW